MVRDNVSRVRRRDYLKATAGSVALAGLAGCGGDGGGDDGTTTTTAADGTTTTGDGTTTAGTPLDDSYTVAEGFPVPGQLQFNHYNSKNLWGYTQLFDPLAHYSPPDREFVPMLASDWQFEGDTVTLTLDDRYTWSNGDALTTEDVKLHFELAQFLEEPITDFVSNWSVEDESTMTVTKASADMNPAIFSHYLLTERPATPRAVWADHVDDLQQAADNSQDALDEKINQILTMELAAEDIVTSGVFEFSQFRGQQGIELQRRSEGHPLADSTAVPKVDYLRTTSREQRVQALSTDNADGQMSMPLSKAVEASLPSHIQRVVMEGLGGGAVYFNHDNEWFSKSDVRRACAFVIDNEQVTGNANRLPPGDILTGYSNITMKNAWLGDLLDSMTNYQLPTEDAHSRGAELMRNAGAEKNSDDWWADSGGNPIEAPSKAISGWTGAMVMNQTLVDNLRAFGIKAENIGIESNTYFNQHWDTGNFVLAKIPIGFGTRAIWHPYYYSYYAFASEASKQIFNASHSYEVPPVGEPDGTPETMDAPALVEELRTTSDEEREQELVRQLAWIYNQAIPLMENNKETINAWLTNDEWNYPAVANSQNPPEVFQRWTVTGSLNPLGLMSEGHLTPKYE